MKMAKRTRKIAKKKNPMQTAFTRFMLVVAFFILWIGAIGVRLVHLQINQSDWLRGKALGQRRDQIKSKSMRGTIYDRTDRALAMSIETKSLFADPAEIENVEKTAREVAKVLKLKPENVLKELRSAKEDGKRFVWLARKLDEETADRVNAVLKDDEVKKLDLPKYAGIHWKNEEKRSYPYKSLAAQVIGFSNADAVGQAGVEQSQEEILRGAIIKGWQDRDRLGRVYDESETEEREPPKDIVLTISNSIQYKTEQALENGVKAANAKSGMAIVMDPKSGEILAMANYPTFDPNNYSNYSPESYTNRTLQSLYSPGSVFKIVSYSGALQENQITPEGEIDCRKGFIEVAGHRFSDPHATSVMSYTDALAVSSNQAAIKNALGLGKERFYNYARSFGFGQTTGIELPAEGRGQFRSPESWNGDSLASMSIGYEVSVTALQMVSAYSAIANDGVRVQPHIIKEIRQADGTIIPRSEPERAAIINPETARSLRQMLQSVVSDGTAKKAQLNGYTSAGKTGTAWKYDPKIKKYNPSKLVASFTGFAPADNPSVVIAVVMDEPQGGQSGGMASAPVFRDIAEQILPELNVVPDANIKQEVLTAQDIPSEAEAAPTDVLELEDPEQTKKAASGEIKKSSKGESPGEDKKAVKTKTAVLSNENKNKSAGDKSKQKT